MGKKSCYYRFPVLASWFLVGCACGPDSDPERNRNDRSGPPLPSRGGGGLPGRFSARAAATAPSSKSGGGQTEVDGAENDIATGGKAAAAAPDDGVAEPSARKPWKEAFYDAFAMFAVGISAAAMAVEGSLLVNVVGIACAILGPAAAFKQRRISDIESLKQIQGRLEDRVKRLQAENRKLSMENDRLEEINKKLEETEAAFREISNIQGQSVDLLVEQVQEYKKIQQDMQISLQANIIQNLLSVIVHCDEDEDFQIDPEEIPKLVLKLKNLNGVVFNEANFLKAIERSGYSLEAVLEVTKNLLDDRVPDKDNIFVVKTEKLLPKSLKKELNI